MYSSVCYAKDAYNFSACVVLLFVHGLMHCSAKLGLYSMNQLPAELRRIDYDKYSTPSEALNASTTVSIGIYVEALSSFQATTMSYTMDVYFREHWQDPRLSHNASAFVQTHDLNILQYLWTPDVFFANSKEASFQYVTVPNTLLRIYPSGQVYLSRRIRLTLSCNMQLTHYPMDAQNCTVKMLSYTYTVDKMRIFWMESEAFVIAGGLELADFKLLNKTTHYCEGVYWSVAGNYSCLEAVLMLHRLSGFHLYQTYLPSACIVAISWISFFLSPHAVPARVTLSITTLLTLSTQASGVRTSLPPVSYTKAIDIWMSTCVGFVVAALLEFTFVNMLMEKSKPEAITNEVTTTNFDNGDCVKNVKSAGMVHHSTLKDNFVPRFKVKSSDNKQSNSSQVSKKKLSYRKLTPQTPEALDKTSRILFPFAFVAFNIYYWTTYQPVLN